MSCYFAGATKSQHHPHQRAPSSLFRSFNNLGGCCDQNRRKAAARERCNADVAAKNPSEGNCLATLDNIPKENNIHTLNQTQLN